MSTPTLTAQGVSFRYHSRGGQVLQDVTLTLPPATFTVLLGPNGSGKSTLIKCLAGIHRPTTGTVQIGDKNISQLSAPRIADYVAYAPQSVPTPFAFTVAEFLNLGAANGASLQSKGTADALQTFELTDMLSRSLLGLSGGEHQRVVVARAFAQQAPILLLDEPTAHLDLRHQVRLMEAARQRARQGSVVCVVLHDLNLAAAFADTLVLLDDGKIAASGSVSTVMQHPVLDSVYHAAIQVLPGPDGKPIILPAPEAPGAQSTVQDLTLS